MKCGDFVQQAVQLINWMIWLSFVKWMKGRRDLFVFHLMRMMMMLLTKCVVIFIYSEVWVCVEMEWWVGSMNDGWNLAKNWYTHNEKKILSFARHRCSFLRDIASNGKFVNVMLFPFYFCSVKQTIKLLDFYWKL